MSDGSQDRCRVTQGDQSFDIEKRGGTDKHGNPVWLKLEYHRKRSDLLKALSRLGLSANLAGKVPPHHPAAFRALSLAAKAQEQAEQAKARPRSQKQLDAIAKAQAARWAKRDA